LDLDAWINEPEMASEEEEEENLELDESETEEAVERVLSPHQPQTAKTTTSHYGAENLPQHGRKKPLNDAKVQREQSPTSYHQQTVENGLPSSSSDKRRRTPKESAESVKKRRETEQESNPFYVKDYPKQRPNKMALPFSSSIGPGASNQPEFLQSPLDIAGVVGMEKYLEQKESTLSWKSLGKTKKKQQGKAEESGGGQPDSKLGKKKNRKNKKAIGGEMLVDNERQGSSLASAVDGNGNSDEGEVNEETGRIEEHFVYKGDGEMPEGALESSEEEEKVRKGD
jgi:hypothetical protein